MGNKADSPLLGTQTMPTNQGEGLGKARGVFGGHQGDSGHERKCGVYPEKVLARKSFS